MSPVSLAVTSSLGHRLEGLTDGLNKPPQGDGLLMLLGALALGVLVLAGSSLLRLLNRIAGQRWQEPAA